MATGRTLKLLVLSTTFGSILAGCVTPGAAQAPSGVQLDGAWKLDRTASDDPQQELDKLREAEAKNVRRASARYAAAQRQAQDGSGDSGRRRGRGGSVDDESNMPGPVTQELAYNPGMKALQEFLHHGDYLTVRQEPDHFVLDYGTGGRTFTPGAHSVISAETGVADQTTGWKSGNFVINVRPQVGPAITETYGLSEDKKHLVVKLHVNATDLPAIDLKQVYAHTDESLPRSMPTND